MFTALCWLFFVPFSLVSSSCWFAGKTRNTNESCYGKIMPLSPGLARAANVPEQTLACLRHRRRLERQDNRCSSPLLERHTKRLADIPMRVYEVLNIYGENKENYRPGGKWCYACKKEFYARRTENDGTMDARRRRKVS